MASPWDDIYEEKPTPPAWVWVCVVAFAIIYCTAGLWGRI
jgi:hypothetical protein